MENADAYLTEYASKINEDNNNMNIITEEKQDTAEYKNFESDCQFFFQKKNNMETNI